MDNITREEIEEIFEDDSTEIEWEGDNAFQGLQIISEYTDNLICGAEHDIIYSEGIDELIRNGITREDFLKLRKLNWMLEAGDYLACFV